MIEFQEKLTSYFTSKTLDKIPHVICLIGDKGCGKHTLARDISTLFEIPLYDVTTQIDVDKVNEIILSVLPAFYLINVDDITVKEQNILLKLLEEPVNNAYIILIASSKSIVLNTVLNRCTVLSFDKYTKDQLKTFNTDESAIKYVTTPGQALEAKSLNIADMLALANKILDCIRSASFANCLILPDKLAYKEDEMGYPVDLFSQIFFEVSSNRVKNNADSWEEQAWICIKEFVLNIKTPHSNKKHLFEHCLAQLKCIQV